jgi:hypothetical protein
VYILRHGYIFGGILLIATMVFTTLVSISIQMEYRQQARYNLEQIVNCLENTLSYKSIDESFYICTSKSRTTSTGDVYVLNGETLEFVHENSRDVPQKNMYFTEDSVGKYFKDWDSAIEALKYITSGRDSSIEYNTSYNFDGDKELLEWVNYVYDNKWYIIVQGVQKDEALNMYNIISYLIYLGSFLIAFFCIVLEKRECKICHLTTKKR